MKNVPDEIMRALGYLSDIVNHVARHANDHETNNKVINAMKAGLLLQDVLIGLYNTAVATPINSTVASTFKIGDTVWYRDRRGGKTEQMVPGVVMKVHVDDAGGPPYYDVNLSDGTMPQTVCDRLCVRSL